MKGAVLIAQERARQIEAEGFTASHDSQHNNGALAWAAMYYAMPRSAAAFCTPGCGGRVDITPMFFFEETAWDTEFAKRDGKDRIRQLTVAGALLAAEIDRLLEAQKRDWSGHPDPDDPDNYWIDPCP